MSKAAHSTGRPSFACTTQAEEGRKWSGDWVTMIRPVMLSGAQPSPSSRRRQEDADDRGLDHHDSRDATVTCKYLHGLDVECARRRRPGDDPVRALAHCVRAAMFQRDAASGEGLDHSSSRR